MLPTNVRIASARYANAQNTLVFVLLTNGDTWHVIPNNGSGQANLLAAWVMDGGSVAPFVPPVPGAQAPVGSLIWFASRQTPVNYLLANGQAVKRRQYNKLFSVIGTTFGVGDGSTTFNVPDLRGKAIRGWGPVNPLDFNRVFGSSQTGTLQTHRHSITDPGHTHDVNDPGHVHPIDDPGHTHVGDDPGHTHPTPNLGPHSHDNIFLSTGYGFGIIPAAYTGISEGITYPDFTPQGLTYDGTISSSSAGLTINTASANLLADTANADVSDQIGFTGITVVEAVTNITETEDEGGQRVLPWSLTLIPYIRF